MSETKGSLLTVQRALDVIEVIASSKSMGVTELASELALPKANVYRLLNTLRIRGYVAQDRRNGKYSLGLRCFELCTLAISNLDLRAKASPYLHHLNEATKETIHLAIYDEGGEIIYIEKVESPLPVAPKSRVGLRAPAFCVATGRALLAYQPLTEIEAVLERPLPQFTPHTINDPHELRTLLEEVRTNGYATNQSNWREGVCGIAAPVRDHSGGVVASIGCCVPEARFAPSNVRTFRKHLLDATAELSAELGFVAPSKRTIGSSKNSSRLKKGRSPEINDDVASGE